MSVYIYVNQQAAGPFEENVVMAWLRKGELSPEVLACPPGASAWQPLRNLFPAPAQAPVFNVTPRPNNQPRPDHQPVVEWARQTIPGRVEVKLKYNSPVVMVLCCVALFFTPAALFLFGIYHLLTAEAPAFSLVMLVIAAAVAGLFALFLLLVRMMRKNFARYLDVGGVETRGGKRYGWEGLQQITYKKIRGGGLVVALMYAGMERLQVDLTFQTGKAVIPPLIHNQKELLRLLENIPAQRRDG